MVTDGIDDKNKDVGGGFFRGGGGDEKDEVASADISSYRTPSAAIVDALLETTGKSRGDLPPLYQYFDPEALDTLFDSIRDGQTDPHGKLELQYADYRIHVHLKGSISIYQS